MPIDDFQYMRRGRALQALTMPDRHLLRPIDVRGAGHARALFLLHGFASTPAVYRELLPALSAYDAVVCPVLPGHADSVASFAKVCARDWLETAEHACEDLLRTYHTVDVLGLSLGGLLACHLSHRFSLHRVYLLAPALILRMNVTAALIGAHLLRSIGVKRFCNRAGNLHTNKHAELTYRQLPLTTIIELLQLIRDTPFVAPTCPVDLFLGRFDAVVDSEKVARLFKNLPNVQTHWLNNSAHVLPLDGDIDIITACIQAHNPRRIA